MAFFAVAIAIVAVVPHATFNKDNFAPVFDGCFDMGRKYCYLSLFTYFPPLAFILHIR
jgi:hypothetical protein